MSNVQELEMAVSQQSANELMQFSEWFEDFVADQEGTLRHIFEFLEIAIPENFQMPVSRRKMQSDSLSDLWAEKFNRGDPE